MDNKTKEAWDKATQQLQRIADISSLPGQYGDHAIGDRNRNAKWYQAPHRWKVWVEIVAYIFAIGYAIVTFCQWHDANTNFRAGQRACVLVDKINLTTDKDGNAIDFSTYRPTMIVFQIKNYGLSPALHLWSETDGRMTGGNCDRDPFLEERSPYVSYSTLGPGGLESYPNYGMSPISQPCLDSLNDGTATYEIRGQLHYRDIFGDEHTTEVCSRYEGMTSHNMTACKDHTDAN